MSGSPGILRLSEKEGRDGERTDTEAVGEKVKWWRGTGVELVVVGIRTNRTK